MSELIGIFESGDDIVIALAKSELEKAGIPFIVKNEVIQDLFGLGRIGTGYCPLTGPIQIQVEVANRERAVKLLSHLQPESSDENS